MKKLISIILVLMFASVSVFAAEAAEKAPAETVKVEVAVTTVTAVAADIICYVEGDWQVMTFTENGVPVAEWIVNGSYIDKTGRQLDGNVTITGQVDDGEFSGIMAFKNNEVVNGEYKTFFTENKRLHSIGKFRNSLKDGYWEYFHRTGRLMATGDYKLNIMTGYWSFYDDKGFKYDGGWYNGGEETRNTNIDNFDWISKNVNDMKYKR